MTVRDGGRGDDSGGGGGTVRDGGRGDDSGGEVRDDGGVMTVCDECVCVWGGDDSEGWRKRITVAVRDGGGVVTVVMTVRDGGGGVWEWGGGGDDSEGWRKR